MHLIAGDEHIEQIARICKGGEGGEEHIAIYCFLGHIYAMKREQELDTSNQFYVQTVKIQQVI